MYVYIYIYTHIVRLGLTLVSEAGWLAACPPARLPAKVNNILLLIYIYIYTYMYESNMII